MENNNEIGYDALGKTYIPNDPYSHYQTGEDGDKKRKTNLKNDIKFVDNAANEDLGFCAYFACFLCCYNDDLECRCSCCNCCGEDGGSCSCDNCSCDNCNCDNCNC